MLVLLVALAAQADIPPPIGYVEKCTVAKQTTAATECVSCQGYHGGREPCEALEAEGYTKSCQTRGASVWDEVMCRPKAEGATPAAEPAEKPPEAAATPAADSSSSKCDSTGIGAIGAFAWLLPAMAMRRRRA